MSRPHNPICPRCGIRPKSKTYKQYCLECGREINRARDRRKAGTVRGKRRKAKNKVCPLCGGEPLYNHVYCAECSALPQRIRDQRMVEMRDRRAKEKREIGFADLQAQAVRINFLRLRARGVIGRQPEPPPKHEIALSDFLGRDDEPSIFQHL